MKHITSILILLLSMTTNAAVVTHNEILTFDYRLTSDEYLTYYDEDGFSVMRASVGYPRLEDNRVILDRYESFIIRRGGFLFSVDSYDVDIVIDYGPVSLQVNSNIGINRLTDITYLIIKNSSYSTIAIDNINVSWTTGEPDPEPAEVPVPAAAWLFASALIGLTSIKRKT